MSGVIWTVAAIVLTLGLNTEASTISAVRDPFITTAAGEHFHLDVPCRFEFVNVVTKFKNSEKDFCHVVIAAYNRRSNGQFFVGGFDVAINIPHLSYHKFLKADGWSVNGESTYTMAESRNGREWEESNNNIIVSHSDLEFNMHEDEEKDRVKLNIYGCHVKIDFKAGDMILKPSKADPPGLTVDVDDNYVHIWAKDGKLVGLPPFRGGQTVGAVVSIYQLSPIQAFLERVFHANITQEFFTASDQCAKISEVVGTCDESRIPNAFKMCTDIITTTKYVSCYSKLKGDDTSKSDSILTLFKECIIAFCVEDENLCTAVVDEVRDVRFCGFNFWGELKLHTCQFQTQELSEEARALLFAERKKK